jgi:GT2 family glycosyltransferase
VSFTVNRFAICTVTYNSADELDGWAQALRALDPAPTELCVVDNNSSDSTWQELERVCEDFRFPVRLIHSEHNLGFAAGMNRAISATGADLVVLLNPDARPAVDFLAMLPLGLEQAGAEEVPIGAVAARLVRPRADDALPPLLDACGMVLSATWRHFDRGSEEVDHGQFNEPAWMFGATGAASLFVRAALDDVAIDGAIFDEDFHTFREDAELCFRLQERGWRTLYEPRAHCVHTRSNTPGRRRQMSDFVNHHTLKNRYLLRLYHQTFANLWLTALPTLLRDIGIFFYVVGFERQSLSAYTWLWRNRWRLLARRRTIQTRRTVAASEVNRWFFRH